MSQAIFSDPNIVGSVVLTGTGNGTLVLDRTTHFTIAQTYVVTCIATSPDVLFTVVGSLDGSVGIATSGTQFFDDELKVFFTVSDGATAFIVGDYFTFEVVNGTDLNQTNIDSYDEVPQKNFGTGVAGTSAGDHNVRYSNTSLAASLFIQDLKFTAVTAGVAGDSITIEYTTGATAGAEVVSVVSNAIGIQIQDGVSTATQVKAALDGDVSAAALIATTIIGLGSNPQFGAVAATALSGGKNKNFALNHNEVTDSGSFVEGNANLLAKKLTLLGDFDVTGHAHLRESLSLNDAVAANVSGNAVPNVQKWINRLISLNKIQVDTVGNALIAWDGGDLSCAANIQIRLRDGTIVNTIDMTSPITLADGESAYVVLNGEAISTVAVVIATTVSTNSLAYRLATRFGTDLIMFNGTVLAANEGAKIGSGGSATAATAGSVVRRDGSGDFAAHDVTMNKALVAPGASAGLDVSSAGNLEIGVTVGANDITLGGATTRVVIPGSLEIQGTVTTVDTTNLDVTDKLVTINKGGTAASGAAAGLEVEEDALITGYAKTSADRNSWEFKSPNTAGVASLTPGAGADVVVLAAESQTLTNKTIDGDDNTVKDLPETALKTVLANADNFFTRDASGIPESATKAVPTGAVVGDSDAQVLSNKTFSDSIIGTQITTPSTPAAGYDKLYFKADDKLYKLDSTGAEVEVGTGGGGGINYILNSDAEDDATDSSLPIGWVTYADAAGVVPVDGTGTAASGTVFSATDIGPIRGVKSFLYTKQAGGSRQGEGASYDFEIDDADRAKILTVSFDMAIFDWNTFVASDGITPPANSGTTANAGNSTLQVFIYDVTNSILIPVTPSVLTSNSITIPQSFKGSFQTDSVSTSYRLIIHTSTTEAAVMTALMDNFYVGPQSIVYGSAITDWQTYTPSSTQGFGTIASNQSVWRRVGDSVEIRGKFTAGTLTASEARFGLPPGLTSADTSKIPGKLIVGTWGIGNNAAATVDASVLVEAGATYVTFGESNTGTASFTSQVATNINLTTGNLFGFTAVVPIAGWSSTTLMSNDTDTRVVAASYSASGTAATSGFTALTTFFNTKIADTHSAYNTTTGLYTIPVSGLYRISGMLKWGIITAAGEAAFSLKINGSSFTTLLGDVVASTNFAVTTGSQVRSFTAGETIQFEGYSGAASTLGGVGVKYNYFSIERLTGPATIAASESVNASIGLTSAVAPSANAVIKYDTVTFDSHNSYSVSTGLYTCSISGKYRVSVTATTGTTANIYIKVAGTAKGNLCTATAGSGYSGSIVVKCVAGDTIGIYPNAGGTFNATDGTVGYLNHLDIDRVGN